MLDQSTKTPEQWRPVVGYEDTYEISDLGRVRRIRAGANGRYKPGYVRKPQLNRNGYLRVMLERDGVLKIYYIHRLVAFAFLGAPPSARSQVNHIDRHRSNNALANLEWSSPSENNRHAWVVAARTGRAVGARNGGAKLTDADVREVRRLKGTKSYTAICAMFGISRHTLWAIYAGRRWSHV